MFPLLLFLDFDGVLHARSGQSPFQVSCIAALTSALSEYPIEIVVASTWRESQLFELLCQKLSPLNKPVVGITPVLDEPFITNVRFHEVMMYLSHANQHKRDWFAIDDTPGFYPDTAPVYWTDPLTGFTLEDVEPLRIFIRNVL